MQLYVFPFEWKPEHVVITHERQASIRNSEALVNINCLANTLAQVSCNSCGLAAAAKQVDEPGLELCPHLALHFLGLNQHFCVTSREAPKLITLHGSCRGLLAAAAEDDEGDGGAVNAMDSASAAGDSPEVLSCTYVMSDQIMHCSNQEPLDNVRTMHSRQCW